MTSSLLLFKIYAYSMHSVGENWNLEDVRPRPLSGPRLSLLTACLFARSFLWTVSKLAYVCYCKACLYLVGLLLAIIRSERNLAVRMLLGAPYRGLERLSNSNIRIHWSAPSRVMCRCLRVCSKRKEKQVCQAGRTKYLTWVIE